MKIVHLTEYFQPKIGYQEYYLALEQQKLGHEVTVVTSDRYFPFHDFHKIYKGILKERIINPGKFIEENVSVIRLPVLFEFGHGSAIYLKNLFSTVKNISPDIIEVDGVFSILSWQISTIAETLGIPLVYDSHASTFNTKLNDTFIKKIYYYFFKLFAIPHIKRCAKYYLAVGESEKYLLQREYSLKDSEITIIPLGADTSKFKFNEKHRNDLRKQLRIPNNTVVFIYAGKITPNKDIHILLDAFNRVSRNIPNVKMLLIGDGNPTYINTLEDKIKEYNLETSIIFHPFVKHKDLAQYFSAADIGIWPGNLSNTILEALSCSLPIIVPKVISEAQTSDHLVSYKNGFQFKRGSRSSLADAIEKFKNKTIRKQMGEASKRLVMDFFDWEAIAEKHLRIYNQILQ
ncbi:glycosyltransferase family 4 protein [Candidatus Gottesmanbacteria bacterium]|nr:glycosyltransferase family 4 protein [Candidatus Gottesmanbacteria bacterium]